MKSVSPTMTKATSIQHKSLALALGLTLLLAACGGSSSDGTATSGEETTAGTSASESSQGQTSESPDAQAEESDAAMTEESGAATAEESEPVRLTDANPEDDIALFTITGSDDIAFTVSSCTGAGESTVNFQGQSDAGTSFDADATDMVGGIFIDGPEGSFEGSIDLVMVGDSGWTTVSGMASVADHTATDGPMEFTINGFVC